MNRLKRIVREPLVHFVLLGAAIFAAYGLGPKRTAGDPADVYR